MNLAAMELGLACVVGPSAAWCFLPKIRRCWAQPGQVCGVCKFGLSLVAPCSAPCGLAPRCRMSVVAKLSPGLLAPGRMVAFGTHKARKALAVEQAERALERAVRKRRRTEAFTADVKAFAVKAFEESGNAAAAAASTQAHFAARHRVFSLDPRLVPSWVASGLDRFEQNSRGGG